MLPKEFYKSKTFWFGVLYVVVSIAGLFGFQTYQPSATLVDVLGIVTGAIVILLRLVTSQPIK